MPSRRKMTKVGITRYRFGWRRIIIPVRLTAHFEQAIKPIRGNGYGSMNGPWIVFLGAAMVTEEVAAWSWTVSTAVPLSYVA